MTFLKILYGPYEAYGVIKHRFQKVRGLYNCLTNMGYEIEIIEVNLINRLTIEIYNRAIFSCDIRNLMFNLDCEDDVVCQKAVSAVQEANARMAAEINIPKYTSIDKGKRHINELKDLKLTQDLLSQADLFFEHPHRWSAN
ncbi:hypothetical protein NQ314_010094 [Rhamnusium bicolor]|uniref:Uncharacterized protein n=1 Tax=Rhamnusium bicolor TaxID=1586634 RepID=A0AAV8XV41_9CUCU|nr:hypothetical protein NQ314_010094 [Rhamnusium bicolor]